ncbi:MAG: ABC transporter permease [Blastocatellia bacterium]|nr:ABC transporter permease [Blastocatellia bacterium]
MGNLWQDLRYAIRMLIKKPGYTAVALVALVIGIGANTAIFSVVNAVLLRPLPYADPDRLVVVYSAEQRGERSLSVCYPDFLDWRDQNSSFEKLAAVGAENFILTGTGEAERIRGELVSAEYFDMLGIPAVMGRTFLPEENLTSNSAPVAVVGYNFWRNRFGAAPDLLGKTLKLNDTPYTVIGILPEGFDGFTGDAEIWVPMMMFDRVNPSLKQYEIMTARSTRWHQVRVLINS